MRSRLLPVAVALLLSCGLTAGVAHAAAPRHYDFHLVRVVSPHDGWPVLDHGVRVVLKVRHGTKVRILVGRRNVTRRFHHVHGGRLVGRITRRQTRRGPSVLRVIAHRGRRRDLDHLLLVGVHHKRGFLRIRLHRTARGAAPVDLSIRTRAARVFLRVYLNGHRLERRMVPGRLGERHLRLTTVQGLRFGRNRLKVVAHNGRGVGAVRTRVFRVARRGPLAAARFARIASVTGTARLDAGPSRPAHGGRLRYRWRLLHHPRHTRARIAHRASRVAHLIPRRPGRYRIRLTVFESPRRAHAARTRSGSYTFDLAAQTLIPPYGLELRTLDDGIGYAQHLYGDTGGAGKVQVLVLDRGTGQVLSNETLPGVSGTGARDIGTLAEDMADAQGPFSQAQGFEQMVVLRAPQASTPDTSKSDVSALQDALSRYGADNPADEALQIAQGGAFSMIAVPGMEAGQAAINLDDADPNSVFPTLAGQVRATGADGALRFEQTEMVPYNLGGSQANATIGPVNGATVTIPPAPVDGISLTAVDAHTLAAITSASVQPNTSVTPILQLLSQYLGNPAVFFVFRYNAYEPVYGDAANFYAMVNDLAQLGANRDLIVRSTQLQAYPEYPGQGGSNYVFIGGAGIHGIDGSPLKTITGTNGPETVSDVNLQGFLVQEEHGRFEPAGGTNAGAAFDPTLQLMASTPPRGFTYPAPVSVFKAAEDRLYDFLVGTVFCGSNQNNGCLTLPRGIRINYGNSAFTAAVGSLLSNLHCQSTIGQPPNPLSGEYPSGPTPPYTMAQLDQMRGIICNELLEQQQVDNYLFAPLRALLSGEQGDATLDLLAANSTLLGFIDEKDAVQSPDPLGIASALSSILGTGIGALDVEGGPEVGAILNVASGVMSLASQFGRTDTADEQTGEIEVEAGDLYTDVTNQYAEAGDTIDEIEGLIFSDQANLATATSNTLVGAEWYLGTANTPYQARTDLMKIEARIGAMNYMWPLLIGSAVSPKCDTNSDSTGNPLSYVANTDIGQVGNDYGNHFLAPFKAVINTVSLSGSNPQTLAGMLFTDGTNGYNTGNVADAPTGASLVQSDFFVHQVANNTECRFSLGDLLL